MKTPAINSTHVARKNFQKNLQNPGVCQVIWTCVRRPRATLSPTADGRLTTEISVTNGTIALDMAGWRLDLYGQAIESDLCLRDECRIERDGAHGPGR